MAVFLEVIFAKPDRSAAVSRNPGFLGLSERGTLGHRLQPESLEVSEWHSCRGGKSDGRKAPVSSFTGRHRILKRKEVVKRDQAQRYHGGPIRALTSAKLGLAPAIAHLPSHDCVGPGYSAMETWHSPLAMWPSLLVVMTHDPLPSAHSLSLRAVFNT